MSACASNTALLKLLLLAWQDCGEDILNTVKKITYMYSNHLLYLLFFLCHFVIVVFVYIL